eukprot:scaffold19985_cov115-Isochrysis_galbana.AAC.10
MLPSARGLSGSACHQRAIRASCQTASSVRAFVPWPWRLLRTRDPGPPSLAPYVAAGLTCLLSTWGRAEAPCKSGRTALAQQHLAAFGPGWQMDDRRRAHPPMWGRANVPQVWMLPRAPTLGISRQ